MNAGSIESRALAAYFRSLTGGPGAVLSQQPTGQPIVRELAGKQYVVLRNAGGVLAVYRVRNDGMLKRLKRWPAELNAL